MKKSVLLIFLFASPLLAKDKGAIINVQVLSTEAWTRTVTVHHAGTAGSAKTDCSTNGTASDPAGTGTATINANTDCTTTSTPGTAPHTTTREIQQETGMQSCLMEGKSRCGAKKDGVIAEICPKGLTRRKLKAAAFSGFLFRN